jgi:hypothetical protein
MDFVTPCCGASFFIETEYATGRVESIECDGRRSDDSACPNAWDRYGKQTRDRWEPVKW